MWPVYFIAGIGLIPAIIACIVKNKAARGILSVISFLGFFGFSALLAGFVLPYYIGVHGAWIPFVLYCAVFVAAMLIAWKPFSEKIRCIAVISVVSAAIIVSAVFTVPGIYQYSLTINQSDEVYLGVYQPFGR